MQRRKAREKDQPAIEKTEGTAVEPAGTTTAGTADVPEPPAEPIVAGTGTGTGTGATARAAEPATMKAAATPPPASTSRKFFTLGSVDPESPYRMLVTLDSRGASLQRAEFSSPKYLTLNDRTGYLGELVVDPQAALLQLQQQKAADPTAPAKGTLVQVVGAGTPAAKAGLKPGDVLARIGDASTSTPIDFLSAFEMPTEPKKKAIFRKTAFKAGEEVTISYHRKGDDGKWSLLSTKATLTLKPLSAIRPETSHETVGKVPHPSLLTTLEKITRSGKPIAQFQDAEGIVGMGQEAKGLNFWSSDWNVDKEATQGDSVTFFKELPKIGIRLEKVYSLVKVPADESENPDYPAYHLNYEVAVKNLDKTPCEIALVQDGPSGLLTEAKWYGIQVSRQWGTAGFRDVTAKFGGEDPVVAIAKDVAADSKVADDKDEWEIEEEWIAREPLRFAGVEAQYFTSLLVPNRDKKAAKNNVFANKERHFEMAYPVLVGKAPKEKEYRMANTTCRLVTKNEQLAGATGETGDGSERRWKFRLLIAPKKPNLLAAYDGDEEELVYYGWYPWVAKPLVGILHFFYSIVMNYGIAIILLTVTVRLALFPLSKKQAATMVKMQELQPEVARLKKQYKDDREGLMKAQRELWIRHECNPMAGCLPMLIQLPIFIGLYRALSVDVELRGAPLISESVRWCSNLAAPDMLINWTSIMPDFINSGYGMFGLGPYFNLLPVLTVILFLMQQKMFTPPPMDDQQAMQQKMMKYMMVFIGLLFYKVPSGLCLYFITSSLWGILERRFLPKAKPAAATADGSQDTGEYERERKIAKRQREDARKEAAKKREKRNKSKERAKMRVPKKK